MNEKYIIVKKYIIVRVSEVLEKTFAVPVDTLKSADKNAEAERLILEKYNNGDIVLDAGDFDNNVEIEAYDEVTNKTVEFCKYPIIRGDN